MGQIYVRVGTIININTNRSFHNISQLCIFGDKRETNKRKKGRKKGYNTILPNPSLISLVCVQVGLQVSSHLQICQRLGQERRLLGQHRISKLEVALNE